MRKILIALIAVVIAIVIGFMIGRSGRTVLEQKAQEVGQRRWRKSFPKQSQIQGYTMVQVLCRWFS